MPVRSLLLATSFPPARGGTETLLYQTARRLSARPLVIAPARASAPDLRVTGVRTTPRGLVGRVGYQAAWRVHPSLFYLRAFWQAAFDAARAHRPVVVMSGHVYLAPLARVLASALGKPWVQFAYGQEVWKQGRPMGLTLADALLRGGSLRSADRLIGIGRFSASLLAEWGVTRERVVCPPFGADLQPYTEPAGGARLLTVCRLVPRKGVDRVIEALPQVLAHEPDTRYDIVGSGPDEPRLRTLADRVGVANRVSFLGRVSDQALGEAYRRCVLFVLPSRRTPDGELEGLGLVYFEAAAHGRPSLGGRSGGEGDAIVDGVTGHLVDGTSSTAVAEALVRTLRDRAMLAAMGRAAWQRVRDTHNWDNAAREVDRVLHQLAGATFP